MTQIKPETLTADDLATLFGVDPRTIRDLASKGVIIKCGRGAYDLPGSITAYVTHLRGVASARGSATAVENLSEARARLAAEQADRVALQNQISRGEMVLADDVARRWGDVLSTIRSRMMALPSRIASDLNLTRADAARIDDMVRDALNDAADNIGADRHEDDKRASTANAVGAVVKGQASR